MDIGEIVMRAKLLQSCPTLCKPMDSNQAPLSLGFSRQESDVLLQRLIVYMFFQFTSNKFKIDNAIFTFLEK